MAGQLSLPIENRNQSYWSVENLGDKQSVVYFCIHDNPGISDRQISKKLGWEINRVTARRNELSYPRSPVNPPLIEACGSAWDTETRRTVTLWKIKS